MFCRLLVSQRWVNFISEFSCDLFGKFTVTMSTTSVDYLKNKYQSDDIYVSICYLNLQFLFLYKKLHTTISAYPNHFCRIDKTLYIIFHKILVGKVTLAINPNKDIDDLYSDSIMEKYRNGLDSAPHIFSVGKCKIYFCVLISWSNM